MVPLRLTPASAHFLAWVLAALAHAIILAVRGATPRAPLLLAQHLAQVVSQDLLLGALGSALIVAVGRLPVLRTARWALLAAGPLGLAVWSTQTELDNLMPTTRVAIGAVIGLGVPAAMVGGSLLRQTRRLRWVALLLATLGMGGVYALRPGEYPVAHGFALWTLVSLGASALVGWPLPELLARRAKLAKHAMLGSIALALPVLLLPMGATGRLHHARDPGSVLPRWIAALSKPERRPISEVAAFGLEVKWFSSRRAEPERPAMRPQPIDNPIVLLLTVDALRYDLLATDLAAQFPELHMNWRRGVRFERAYSPASSTTPAFASVLTGKYFSQLRWEKMTLGSKRKYFLEHEDTVRFPELLTAAGVRTVNVPVTRGLLGRYGVFRGFQEESEIHLLVADQVQEILQRLDGNTDGPVFLMAHFLTPHAPYNQGKDSGEPIERYRSEVAVVDKQLRLLRTGLRERGLTRRIVWIITADHGEEFGEHGFYKHARTIYDELVHVPLIIRIPGILPAAVTQPVTLLDLGPTILDLFGLPTPGHWMGVSLMPSVADPEAELPARPIAFDAGRRMQGLLFPDGLKVTRDLFRGTDEIYDLTRDPREQENLVDRLPDAEARLDAVAGFFDAHELRAPGYETPYRP